MTCLQQTGQQAALERNDGHLQWLLALNAERVLQRGFLCLIHSLCSINHILYKIACISSYKTVGAIFSIIYQIGSSFSDIFPSAKNDLSCTDKPSVIKLAAYGNSRILSSINSYSPLRSIPYTLNECKSFFYVLNFPFAKSS